MEIKTLIFPHTKYLRPDKFSVEEIKCGEENDKIIERICSVCQSIQLSDAQKDDCYDSFLNYHHLKPKWHYEHTLPGLTVLLDLPYSCCDFEFIEPLHHIKHRKTQTYKVSAYDAVLVDKQSTCFGDRYLDTYRLEKTEMVMTSDELFNCDECYNSNMHQECYSDYHKIFKFAHQTCVLENTSADFDGIEQTLEISMDSMAIPVIPILARYYRKIIILDNRTDVDLSGFLGIPIDDVDVRLYLIWADNYINHYLIDNFSAKKYPTYKCVA